MLKWRSRGTFGPLNSRMMMSEAEEDAAQATAEQEQCVPGRY